MLQGPTLGGGRQISSFVRRAENPDTRFARYVRDVECVEELIRRFDALFEDNRERSGAIEGSPPASGFHQSHFTYDL
jgi:hypothetical protein